MALVKCKECGHQISKSATQCPNCGAKIKRTSIVTKLIAGLFALGIFGSILGQCSSQNQKAEEAAQAAAEQTRIAALTPEQWASEEKRRAEAAAAKQEQELRNLGLRWNYSEAPDEMGRGTTKWAMVNSLNVFEFDFPYNKPQRARLELRKHPKYGRDVILSIERGQFLCGIDNCIVSVRFDQGKPQTYSVLEPADNSTTSLFIQNYDRFVTNLRKAKKVYIEARFYQEGDRVFEFDTTGLNWQ